MCVACADDADDADEEEDDDKDEDGKKLTGDALKKRREENLGKAAKKQELQKAVEQVNSQIFKLSKWSQNAKETISIGKGLIAVLKECKKFATEKVGKDLVSAVLCCYLTRAVSS